MVGFSKNEFYNKLLSSVTLLKITSNVTWTQSLFFSLSLSHTYI